ncbi:MAG: Asp23/Gls24 family envelope stress response protein [Defluviitaleaceae bacterium]|nr:Asp23/Gls24 family envelope stress response protein [Defluviitaleaceae bacterium]
MKHGAGHGKIQIADEVIATIAGTAALEVDGLAGMVGNIKGDLAGMLGKKNMAKGVKVEVTDRQASITANVVVKYGYKIHEVSEQVQEKIKVAVETMTGLCAAEINVHVSGVQMEKPERDEK